MNTLASQQHQASQQTQAQPGFSQDNNDEGFPQLKCMRDGCNETKITKVCLFPGCKNNLVCESDECWREHQPHMKSVTKLNVVMSKWPQLQGACQTLEQDYLQTIERKKKEFTVALEGSMKIRETPIFKAIDSKPMNFSIWKASDLTSFVSNLALIDTSQTEFKDVEANKRIEKLRNINVKDGVQKMLNPQQNLSFAINPNPPPVFQPNVLRTNNPLPIFNLIQTQAQPLQLLQTSTQPQQLQLIQTSSQQPQTLQLSNTPVQQPIQPTQPIVINLEQQDDLIISEQPSGFQVSSHITLKFDKKFAYSSFRFTNGNKTISLPMGMSKLAILPQNILLLNEPKIQLVIEYQGGTFLGDGKNKFGLFCGSLNQCTFEEKNHKNQLIVMGDDGSSSLGGEIDEFKIDDEKCQICLTFERTPTSNSLTFLNQKNVEFTIPVDSKADQVYYCIVLSAGGAQVEIK